MTQGFHQETIPGALLWRRTALKRPRKFFLEEEAMAAMDTRDRGILNSFGILRSPTKETSSSKVSAPIYVFNGGPSSFDRPYTFDRQASTVSTQVAPSFKSRCPSIPSTTDRQPSTVPTPSERNLPSSTVSRQRLMKE